MDIKWIDTYTAVIGNGKRFMFRGIIRGQGHPVVTYFADSVDDLLDGLLLDDWIYYVREVQA